MHLRLNVVNTNNQAKRLFNRPFSAAAASLCAAFATAALLVSLPNIVLAQSAAKASPSKIAVNTSAAQPAKSSAKKQVHSKAKKPSVNRQPVAKNRSGSQVASMGTRLGLRSALSDIALNSSAVMVIHQDTNEVLLEKNPDVALPIASITKVMTAIVTLEADLPMSQLITITQADAQLEKYSASRLQVGSQFTRAELLHLALMSSENRAAQALGRSYPGGLQAFVAAMNEKAEELGMTASNFVEPTGLSSNNMSSPRDLVKMVREAYEFPLIRKYSTARELFVQVGSRQQQFRNTNALARGHEWELGLSKTGFIRDAGRCLVMQAVIDQQPVIMIMLDAQASDQRLRDAERIRRWITSEYQPGYQPNPRS
jgi:serine-type D-Ala-D-Ala endopeptidase (penicillin-binding protein 7)